MRLRTRLASNFLLLLTLAIIVVSVIETDRTLDLMVGHLVGEGDLISKQIFEQMRGTLAHATGAEPAVALRQDGSLRTLLDSSRAFGQAIVSVTVLGADGGVVAASNEPDGQKPLRTAPIEALERRAASWIPLAQMPPLWSGHLYTLRRPVEINGRLFGYIEVRVSTALVAAQVHQMVGAMAAVTLGTILLAALSVTLLGNYLLRPVKAITSGVERLAIGSDEVKLEIGGGDELSTLADKFNQLARRVRDERSRWESERGHLFDAFRSISDAVLLVDGDGALLFANAEARERLGLAADGALEGRPLSTLFARNHPLVLMAEAALAAGTEAHDVALEVQSNGASATPFLVSIFTLGHGRAAAGLLIVMRDLAPMRELESVVEYSSRLARLGGLISGVAHQIRNPLNAMTLQLELMRQDAEQGCVTEARIERVRAEIKRLDQAVDALLRFMRPEKLETREVALNDLLVEIGSQVTQGNIMVDYQLDPNLPQVIADGGLLEEALRNLVQNAVQAMPQGGTLRLSSASSPTGFVELRVADEGAGIPPEYLDQIFNLYFTTKNGGSGVGLSLALRAIDLHHGTISVESRVGSGTAFMVRLPLSAEVAHSVSHAAPN